MINKKAQTATEYLIILAVVIVVALVVVAVMGGIPGIGKGAKTKAAASYWKSADIAIDSYAITAAGAITVVARNNLDTTITLNNLTVNSAELSGIGTTLSPGQSVTLTGTTTACSGSFTHAVGINYTDSVTSATYIDDGEGHKLEGKCAQ